MREVGRARWQYPNREAGHIGSQNDVVPCMCIGGNVCVMYDGMYARRAPLSTTASASSS